jgi:hypothetical protein
MEIGIEKSQWKDEKTYYEWKCKCSRRKMFMNRGVRTRVE